MHEMLIIIGVTQKERFGKRNYAIKSGSIDNSSLITEALTEYNTLTKSRQNRVKLLCIVVEVDDKEF